MCAIMINYDYILLSSWKLMNISREVPEIWKKLSIHMLCRLTCTLIIKLSSKKKHARCILLFMDFLQRLLNFEVGKLDEIGPIWTKFPNELVTEVPLPSEKSWASQLSYHQAPWSHQCCQDQFTLFLTSFVYLSWENQHVAGAYIESCTNKAYHRLTYNHDVQRFDSGGILPALGLQSFKYSCRVELMLWVVRCTLILELENLASWLETFWSCVSFDIYSQRFDLAPWWFIYSFCLFSWRLSKEATKQIPKTSHWKDKNTQLHVTQDPNIFRKVPLGSKQWHWVGPRFPAKSLFFCASISVMHHAFDRNGQTQDVSQNRKYKTTGWYVCFCSKVVGHDWKGGATVLRTPFNKKFKLCRSHIPIQHNI